jgi:hypothetical protein
MSIQEGTASTRRGTHCGSTCPPGSGVHHTGPIIVIVTPFQSDVITYGVVTGHTAKFVTFAPKDCSREGISILPKSLILAPPSATTSLPSRRGETRTQSHITLSDGAEMIKLAHKVNKSEITLHKIHSPRQQASLSPTDTSFSCAPFITSDPLACSSNGDDGRIKRSVEKSSPGCV